MDYPWPPPYRTRAVQQLIKGLAWGPPTSRAVWAALESPITATAAPTSTTSLPATTTHPGQMARLRLMQVMVGVQHARGPEGSRALAEEFMDETDSARRGQLGAMILHEARMAETLRES